MKRALIIGASLVFTLIIVAFIGVLLAPQFIDFNTYKDQASAQIKTATGYDVDFTGDVSLGLFPMPHVSLHDVTVKNPAGFNAPHLAYFKSLDVAVAMAPLFSGDIDVKSVSLNTPDINLETNANGQSNWAMAQKEKKDEGESDNAAAPPKKRNITLNTIDINDGRVSYAAAGKAPMVVTDIDLDIDGKSLQGPFDIDGNATSKGQTVDFKAKIKEFKTLDDPLSVTLSGDIDPADLAFTYAGIIDAKAQAAQGQTEITLPDTSLKAMVDATAKQIKLTEMTLNTMGRTVTGTVTATPNPMTFEGAINTQGVKNATLAGSYDEALNIALQADAIDFDQVMASLKKEKAPAIASNGKDGKSTSQTALPINFDVSVDKAIYSKQPISGLKAKGTLKGNALTLTSASVAQAAGLSGQASGRVNDIKALSGIDMTANGTITNMQSFAALTKMDAKAIPEGIQTLGFDVSATGDAHGAMNTKLAADIAKGTVTLNGTVNNAASKPEMSDMNVHLKHPNLSNFMAVITPDAPRYSSFARPADIKTKLTLGDKIIVLNGINGSVGGTTLAGDVTMRTGGTVPALNGDLTFGDLVIKSAGTEATGGNAKGTSKGKTGAQKWSSAPMNSAWLNAVNADFTIKANSIVYETWDVKSPDLSFKMQDGVLNISKLNAGLYGGSLSLSTVLKAANNQGQGMNIDSQASFNGVDLEKLAGSFIGTRVLSANGKADLDVNVAGQGVSQMALVSALNGSGSIKSDGTFTIKGIDVAQFTRAMSLDNKPGDTVEGLFSATGRSGETVFNSLKGGFDMKQGVMTIQNVSLDGPSASVASTGTISLPKWYMNTAHTITAKGEGEDLPTFTININGPLDNPTQNIAQGALQNYLQQKLGRKLDKVLTDKLDLGTGDGPIEQKLFNKFVGDKLNKKLGTTPTQAPANDTTVEPAGGDAEALQTNEQPAPAPQKSQEQEVIEGVLKGLFQ